MQYTISPYGLAFIKKWESFRANAYLDIAGIPTIGYGTTVLNGKRVRMGMTITEPEANAAFMKDVLRDTGGIGAVTIPPLNQNQVDSVSSFVYNLGIGAYTTSTLLRMLNAGQPIIEDYFLRWNKYVNPQTGKIEASEGLTRRRAEEFALFMSRSV